MLRHLLRFSKPEVELGWEKSGFSNPQLKGIFTSASYLFKIFSLAYYFTLIVTTAAFDENTYANLYKKDKSGEL